MKEIYIHGFRVKYEDDTREAVNYLSYDLDREEALVFFEQAKIKYHANFETDREGQFTLIYNPDRSYTLIRRK